MQDFISSRDQPKKSPLLIRQIISIDLISIFDLLQHCRHIASNANLSPQGMTDMPHISAQITNGLVGIA
jgi:hypothetical protein